MKSKRTKKRIPDSEHAIEQVSEIENITVIGCYTCLFQGKPEKPITADDDSDTMFCPKCGSKTILFTSSLTPFTPEILELIKDYYAEESPESDSEKNHIRYVEIP